MIQIHTSNYSKARKLDKSRYYLVSISIFPPKEWRGANARELAPSYELLTAYHNGLSKSDYEKEYRKQIARLNNLHSQFEWMAQQANGRDIVLLCYEKASDFCHRHILSDIIFEKYGYRITEI